MNEYILDITEDNSVSAREAVEYCKKNNIKRLVLKKGEYHFYSETADEDICCVSNHGYNGYKRTAFLIKDMQDFEIDGSDSLIVLHGAMNAVIINQCKNIKVKNLRVLTTKTQHGQFEVVEVGESYVDITPVTEQGYVYKWSTIALRNGETLDNLVYSAVEMNSYDDEFPTSEQCFGDDFFTLKNEEVAPGIVRIYNPSRKPKLGNYVVLLAAERYSNAVLMLKSENVEMENVCLHSSYGVGFHGQLCRNITIRGCKTERYKNRCFTVNADATHFVGCKGRLEIKDCSFQHQFDDGVNVHSVYTTVVKKDNEGIVVGYVHWQCRGIELFAPGDKIEVLNKKSLIPFEENVIEDVKVLNIESTYLKLKNGTDGIEVGDIIDNVDTYPEVLIENCRFVNNRARGILLKSREKTVIRNNYFHNPGSAMHLEVDASYWYESGCIKDLLVENNVFDRCRYLEEERWGKDIIMIDPREETEEGKYFHGNIVFKNNDFLNCDKVILRAEGVERLEFVNNKLPENAEDKVIIKNCGTVIREEGRQ